MAKKTKSFDELMNDLETMVKALEHDDLNLDDAIQNSEAALDLINECRQRLEAAKQKIDKLVKQADGTWEKEALGN